MSERPSDADLVRDARDAEFKALFAMLHRDIAGNRPEAAAIFAAGLGVLDEAERIALRMVAQRANSP